MQPTFRPVRAGGPGFSIFLVCFVLAAALTFGAWIYYKRGIAAKAGATAPPPPTVTLTTNNNPLARASKTLGGVADLNKEGVGAAENMQVAAPAAGNPTPAAVAVTSSGPKLQGIFYNANNPSAIINGKSMKVGDEANGIKVVSITQKSVLVQAGGQQRELTMK
ncbi:MAG TPA: hypothetical protein VM680_19815 [Verrucomicrobiae bacterium]|nr:hypothetical protein [Verrucomicrobiae bacterium]